MATDRATQNATAGGHAETLEEIARRLVAIHHGLAVHLDGGRELQTQTRKKIEALMAYVDAAIDAEG